MAVAQRDQMIQANPNRGLEVVVDEACADRLLGVAEHHEWKAHLSEEVDPPITQLHSHQDGAVALARTVEVEEIALVRANA